MSSVDAETERTVPRMRAADRRELILRAASTVFGERGYIGATTDQVARAAGISQPYVVRMFGSKEQLFIAVVDRSVDLLLAAFRAALIAYRDGGEPQEGLAFALGNAYVDLVRERGVHLSLLQSFVQGHDPALGAHARSGFLTIWRMLIDEAGFDEDAARGFLAQGMLITVLLAVGLPLAASEDPDAMALLRCTFGAKADMVIETERSA